MEYVFTMKMSVRDYECDLQGIVNNANYLHYIEHTRHEFLKHAGANFAELHNNGIDAVVARMNLQYKTPLRSNDIFESCLNLTKEGIRYTFHQDIYNATTRQLCFRASVDVACIINNRLGRSEELDTILEPFLLKKP
jgi:thioesterase family protein